MRLNLRDLVGTILVAVIAVMYVFFLLFAENPVADDVRRMAVATIVIGFLAFLISSGNDLVDGVGYAELGLAVVALALGVTALVTGNDTLLAAFMGAILVVWLVELVDHFGVLPHPRPH